MGSEIGLGTSKNGRNVFIKPNDRSTHMQIIGSTGEGKSKFLEHLIREDILNNQGLCLIDPHGHLYNDIVRWCESKHFLGPARRNNKKIILFDPQEENWAFGFNPLRVHSPDLSFHVDAMVRACAKVWGGEDTDKTPLLKKCLRLVFHALAEKQLSLLESQYLIMPQTKEEREFLTGDLEDPFIRTQWEALNQSSNRVFDEKTASTSNRLMEFLSSPIIRNIIGQTEETIDFRNVMDEGYILLVNLASKDRISDDNARLLGSLIVNDLFMAARGRPSGSNPFYLYIDECARFINEDVARILDEGRKFGLHLILAHQHLSQLKKAGEDIYNSVMTDAKTKVIFGGLSAEDAEVLARQIFLGELDLQEGKDKFNKPTVIGYMKTILESWGHSSGSSSGGSRSTGQGFGSSSSDTVNEDGDVLTSTSGVSSSYSSGSSDSWSDTESEMQGWAEALMPILKDMPTKEYSLEEQIYKGMAKIVNQLKQHAIIKLPKQITRIVKTPTVKDSYANDNRIDRFKKECYKLSYFAKPKTEVETLIEDRRAKIEHDSKKHLEDPESFRE